MRMFAAARAKLGEGPVWFDGRLWFVDILSEQVCRVKAGDGGAEGPIRRFETGSPPGALAPREKGGLVVALQSGFAAMDAESGEVSPLSAQPNEDPTIRFNDGKCDPRGRFVAGTMSLKGEKEVGKVFALEPDGSARVLFEGVTVSNGLAWTEDGGTMYYIDTPTRRIAAFDYDLETGEASGRRVAVEVLEGMGYPDGMTIDREGNLWVALWGGWGVACYDPRSGELRGKLDVPAENVTCPVFGGPDFDRLFVTTARLERADEEAESQGQPHAGGIFVCEPGVAGYPPVAYAG